MIERFKLSQEFADSHFFPDEAKTTLLSSELSEESLTKLQGKSVTATRLLRQFRPLHHEDQ